MATEDVNADADVEDNASEELFIPEWSVKRVIRMNHSSMCQDMMIHLATLVKKNI